MNKRNCLRQDRAGDHGRIKDSAKDSNLPHALRTKMGRNGHVTTEILVKICAALDCRIEDIVEIVPDE